MDPDHDAQTIAGPEIGDQHIALVGMMGSGKTSIGRRLAAVTNRSFVDADEGYIARYGETVAETFASAGGEALFRARETELLSLLSKVSGPLVIACGGGVVTTEASRQVLMSDRIRCVYLAWDIDAIIAKADAKSHRPLLAGGDIAATLHRLWGEREHLYLQVADVVVDTHAVLGGGRSKRRAARALADRLGLTPTN